MTELIRTPRWEHVVTDAGHHLRLTGANGEPVLTSEVYPDPRQVKAALYVAARAMDGWTSHEPTLIDERFAARPHHVQVTRLDSLGTAAARDPIRWEHHCTVCGYRGPTPPPLPCPGPPLAPPLPPVIDRGPGYEAQP